MTRRVEHGYTCTLCGRHVWEARVWDARAICRDCTFRPVGPCPVCGEEIAATVTPMSNGRTHSTVSHSCAIACPSNHAGPCFPHRPDLCRNILRDGGAA